MIKPHGGKLINLALPEEKKQAVLKQLEKFKTITLNREQVIDVKSIARGVYSPLTGFLKEGDFIRTASEMRLKNGLVWPIPIVLTVNDKEAEEIKGEKFVLLIDNNKKPIALLNNPEVYRYDKDFFAEKVFGTKDRSHPGAAAVYQMKDYLAGGDIFLIDNSKDIYPSHNLTPLEAREIFEQKGWQTIVAFQTRNVPHRGHEFLQKYALQKIDGLFIQPVTGEKKMSDFKDEFILAAYQLLVDRFYPKGRVLLGILPLKMRYAGPREAVMHALIRKNFGCTHFIVGRDHAGVKNFYPPYAAQEIFDQFKKEEIGIEIIKYPKVVWCEMCHEFVFEASCPHPSSVKLSFSGTEIREKIMKREDIPPYFIRPEVYQLLSQSMSPLVDYSYNHQRKNGQNKQKGFVLWFTGLPCSGKSSTADAVYQKLNSMGVNVERLDGDKVRKSLTKDLGFTKEDRDENIRRVGFVAKCLSENDVAVAASFISPYQEERDGVRAEVKNFIEVFCKCPLEVCEQRDKKGMYAKARRGEIKNFTGISDPYEDPQNPEIILETDKGAIEESAEKIIAYLKEKELL